MIGPTLAPPAICGVAMNDPATLLIAAGDQISDATCLHSGARGHQDMLRLSRSQDADLTSLNRFGGAALIPASGRGHADTVTTLIAADVDEDPINSFCRTALSAAVVQADGDPRHRQIVQLLPEGGATFADRDGVTVLQHSRRRGRTRAATPTEQGCDQ